MWRKRVLHAIPVVFLLLCGSALVNATPLYSAEIRAEAGGAFSAIYGEQAGEQNLTAGTPASAAAGYIHRFGSFAASAAAQAGSLGATANLVVNDAPGYLSNSPYYKESYTYGYAAFQDTWFISGKPAGTVGQLRVTSHFEGAAAGSAINAFGEFSGRYGLDLDAVEPGTGNPIDFAKYDSGEVSFADEIITLDLTFQYGAPILVHGWLRAGIRIASNDDAYTYSGASDVNFGDTAELTRLEVLNDSGRWATLTSFESESKQLYPFQSPDTGGSVPEPGTVALMLIGIITIAAHRRLGYVCSLTSARISRVEKGVPMSKVSILLSLSAAFVLPAAVAGDGSMLFQAIRNGDIAFIKAHLTKAEIEARDRRGATPLMHAAAFGNLETLKLLLDAGADVAARNDFDATALLWAARDPERARLLIERGADVNAQSKQGRTPLMVASLRRGGSAIVALMLAKGADVNLKDSRNSTALALAASVGDAENVRLLLAKGADPNVLDRAGTTSINRASFARDAKVVQLLLQKGVDVNNANTIGGPPQKHGPTNRLKVTALHNAAAFGPVEMVRDLLKAGAKVDARDSRGLTPLHFALASEYPSIEMVRTLLRARADVNARDNTGETPLDWAEKFGYPEVIAELKKAGAKRDLAYDAPKRPDVERPEPVIALARSIKLLETTSGEYFKQSGCVGCHHQPLIARAQSLAKAAGVSINEAAAKEQLSQMRGQWLALQEEFLQTLNPGGGSNRLSENLLGLKASGYPADTITDSAIVDMAESQEPDGSWIAGEVQNRPPITQSDFAATARAIRVLQEYAIPARKQEFTDRIGRARAWLKQAKPITTEDVSMRLSGLAWSGAAEGDLKNAAKALLGLQRSDGGWGGNPYMKSDAFATGVALVALAESKIVKVSDRSYQRGAEYLLSTQFPDGSWHVRSRAIKFQPYFESGFPFGHDQWISVAATAWAAQAIALSIEPVTITSAVRQREVPLTLSCNNY